MTIQHRTKGFSINEDLEGLVRRMNLFQQVEDPTDLALLKSIIAQSERPEALVPLGIKHLVISPTASDQVVHYLFELLSSVDLPARPKVLLLVDATPIYRNGADLKSAVEQSLAEHFEVSKLVLGSGGHLHADDDALDAATKALEGASAIVSVGSGTISDIAKVASTRQGGVPHVLVQTAASVDGYTDNVSVVLKSGAKRTIDSRWPEVVLADTEVISSAPAELNTSGFGELLSLFTAPADWWLADQLDTDKSFHTTPRDLLLTFAGNPGQWGEGISAGNSTAVEQLTKVLAIRGIGTGIAGTTACLSGMEHVVSHMLDMYAAGNHKETGLHGKQVGVASVVAASAWEYLLDQIREGRAVSPRVSNENLEAKITEVFAVCDSSGALGKECWSDYSKKLVALSKVSQKIKSIASSADQIETDLGKTLPNAKDLVHGLHLAGAAYSAEQLDAWVSPEIWRWAVSNCHLMRNRVTIADLLDALGWWESKDVDNVLARVDLLIKETQRV
jgi:glycerol-1-phosphate dehydrogenase [NAD(P)+]